MQVLKNKFLKFLKEKFKIEKKEVFSLWSLCKLQDRAVQLLID